MKVSAQHIDVTVELTFFEEWSARERKVMDADAGGTISRTEQEAYLKQLAPKLSQQVKLCVNGNESTLVPLYDPEVDLLGNTTVGPAHHRLRLFFFTPTPELHANDEIEIEVSLWPEAKALTTPQSEGRDGCKLINLALVDPRLSSLRAQEEKRFFKFRCLRPPTTASLIKVSSNRSSVAVTRPSASPPELKSSDTPGKP